MKKNVSGQFVGAQLVSATDGSAFTGSVTVKVTGDAGTQATGSVGSGACTHEGGGYHTYAPAQAETNYDLVAFTFSGTGAVPVTVSIYTLPTTGILAPATANRTLVVDASGVADANVAQISTDATAADNLETMLDGTGGQTLSLGRLVVSSTSADAVVFSTSNSGSVGLNISGSGSGQGCYIGGGTTGNALQLAGGGSGGAGLYIQSQSTANAVTIASPSGLGVSIDTLTISGATNFTGAVALASTLTVTGAFTSTNASNDIRVNVTKFGGTAGTFSSGRPEVNATHIGGNTLAVSGIGPVRTGTAQSGSTAGNIILDSGASSTNDYYKTRLVRITSGTGADQEAVITGYTGSSKTATISPSWATTPDNTSQFAILNWGDVNSVASGVSVTSLGSGVITATSIASGAITSAKFASGAITSTVLAADCIGASQIAADAIGASELASDAVTEIQSGLATASALSTVAGYVDTEVASIITTLGTPNASIAADLARLASDDGFTGYVDAQDSLAAARDNLVSIAASITDIYHADIQFTVDEANAQDEYTVTWFKNGVRQTSGITSPTIQVVKRADGTDLIASTSLTQIGSTGSYKKDATTTARQTAGEACLVIVSATIDAGTRTFSKLTGRDSTA